MPNGKFLALISWLSVMQTFAACAYATGESVAIQVKSISPYIAYHETDLVHWLPWNENSLQLAKLSQKPILISSGYYSCHYCHVMKRESYDNPEIAGFINRYFIPVLIDRELHTALDTQLMQFMSEIGGPQGWPLHVVLTPSGHPLIGTVYRPPAEFLKFLQHVQKLWQDEPAKWEHTAQQAAKKMVAKLTVPAFILENRKPDQFLNLFYEQALLVADREYGGFGYDAKYPMSPQLLALLRLQQKRPNAELKQHLRLSLQKMVNDGLADSLGGGFFRYATERNWHKPHYEKMLYDNVQLAQVYLEASVILQEPQFETVARSVLDFLLHEFISTEGGFVSSLSAVDAEGRDGGYYLWSESELKKLLEPQEFRLIRHVWPSVTEDDSAVYLLPVGIRNINRLEKELQLSPEQIAKIQSSAENKLLIARNKRQLSRDNKRIAGWNGLALQVFSGAARLWKDDRYKHAADNLYRFIFNQLWRDGNLNRTPEGGQAELADYAYLAAGLYEYAVLTNRAADYDFSAAVAMQGWLRFYLDGVWRHSETLELLLPYTVYQVTLPDKEMQSPSATLIAVILKLGNAIDEPYRDLARKALYTIDENLLKSSFFYATQIMTMVSNDASG